MGFLTDPNSSVVKGPLFSLLLRNQNKVYFLFYFGGIVWFASFAYRPLNAGTYFSENALLPGLVEGSFKDMALAQRLEAELKEEQEKYNTGIPYPWLLAKFQQFGIEAYTHNFSLHYPFGEKKTYKGLNVYGILRARRGDSTESIVLSAPYRPPSAVHDSTIASVALILALAKHCRQQPYWAKDVIFLLSEHEQLGAQAWLEAYHQAKASQDGVLDSANLPARAGVIQACINLEMSEIPVNAVDVKIEGLNGQLPNLDLVNLAHRLAARERVKHTHKERADHTDVESFDGFLYSLGTMLRMIATQASGVGNGNHAVYHRYGIQSLTMHAHKHNYANWPKVGYNHIGRVIEGMLRSLNNLLERFHQSFFFYLLPASHRYVSIGVYMLPFGLLGSVLALKAVCLWIENLNALEEAEEKKKNALNKTKKESTDKKTAYDGEEEENKQSGLLAIAPLLVFVHVVGVLVHRCPSFFSSSGQMVALAADEAIFFGLIAVSVSLLTLPRYLNRRLHLEDKSKKLLKCVCCFELGLLLFCVAMYNISLAMVIAVCCVPAYVITSPTTSWPRWCFQTVLIMLVHPLSLLMIFVFIDTALIFPDVSVLEIVSRGWDASKSAVMYSVSDSVIYGNWSYSASCLGLLPTWLLLWTLSNSKHR